MGGPVSPDHNFQAVYYSSREPPPARIGGAEETTR